METLCVVMCSFVFEPKCCCVFLMCPYVFSLCSYATQGFYEPPLYASTGVSLYEDPDNCFAKIKKQKKLKIDRWITIRRGTLSKCDQAYQIFLMRSNLYAHLRPL